MARKKALASAPSSVKADVFTWLFGSSVGLLIAVLWLVFKPVQMVDEPGAVEGADSTARAARHSVVFISGKEAPPRSPKSLAAERAFMSASRESLEVGEQDLNRWMGTTYQAPEPIKTSTGGELEVDLPRFHLDGSRMSIGVVSEVTQFGKSSRVVVQGGAHFEQREGRPVWVLDTMHVGSCPVIVPALREKIFASMMTLLAPTPEVKAAWGSVQEVALADSKMTLRFR